VYIIMNVHIEAVLRSIGVFLAVFFGIKWAEMSEPEYDTGMMITGIVIAILLNMKPK
jgi:hypothetical protein